MHDKSNPFKCKVCLKSFHTKANLVRHSRTHSGEKPFACRICDKKFAVKGNLVKHQATHKEIKLLKCYICTKERVSIQKKYQLNNHMVFHYEPTFFCSYCDHKSYTKCDLKRHEKSHLKNKLKFLS